MWSRCMNRHKKLLVWSSNFLTQQPCAAKNVSASETPCRYFFTRRTIARTELGKIGWFKRIDAITKNFCTNQGWINPPAAGVVEVPLAQTGEGIAECELLKWFVREGDYVEEFQQLCEVQSDKATIEITSRYKGKVIDILFQPGDIVKVGETLLKMLVEEKEAQGPSLNMSDNSILEASEINVPDSQLNKGEVGGVLSTPSVRYLAKQYGLNINEICGTGKDGRVMKEDILKFAAGKGAIDESLDSQVSSGHCHDKIEPYVEIGDSSFEDKTVPLRGFSRAMVKTMSMAAKVPHFYYLEEVFCNSMVKLKALFQKENADTNIKHTYLPFLIKSLSVALSKYPILNSTFNEEVNELVYKGCHNIGVAMATPTGLVVPNIKKVQSLSVLEITKELSRLQQLAFHNKLSSDDISGGTITLSNIGAVGGKFGCPLLNLPEVAIIAIGRIHKLPRFAEDGTVYPASVMNVSIGADHRVVDGATISRFCNEWKHLIEKPELMLLHVR
ncbi:Lipoamide acyltransferase component of branched-chain alpha-keto acid dehydrogenase complex [Nymphaea thermarum]|nr:Lipoamide acyltransferase component of branched-chain alpha-keto acid dehydrogenase complex [Nymphaea thermarum]